MGKIGKPERVKLLCGLILSENASFGGAKAALARPFGPIDLELEPFPFAFTDYYHEEMGENLKRAFVSFERLVDPGDLAEIKSLTNLLEEHLGELVGGELRRRVNVDPGYVERSKLVLASTKNFSHRVYLRGGIFGEVTLIFKGGKFRELEWTYPDYRSEKVKSFLNEVRRRYLSQLKSTSGSRR